MPRTKKEIPQEKTLQKKAKVSYQKEFYSDYEFPNMYFGAIIRSSYLGKLKDIIEFDLPENYQVITASDIPGKKIIESPDGKNSVPVFCQDVSSYKGEPLGMVIGPDVEKVMELANKLSSNFNVENLNVDGKKNLPTPVKKGNAEQIEKISNMMFEDSDNDVFKMTDFKSLNIEEEEDYQTVATRTVKVGPCFSRGKTATQKGIQQAISNCPNIFENTWTYKLDSTYFREPAGAICSCTTDNDETEIEIYAQSLWLSNMRQAVSDVLNIKPENLKINKTRSTNSSSNAVWYNSVIAAQTAVASFVTKKTVKLVYSTTEQKKFMDTMQPIIITHKTGTDEDGKILAMDINIKVKAGFYNPFAQEIVDRLAIASYGCYMVPNLQINAIALATRQPASSLNLQMLDSAAFFAIENQINEISNRLNISPAEIRKINFSSPEILIPKMPFNFLQENKTSYMERICESTMFERIYYSYKLCHDLDTEQGISPLSQNNSTGEKKDRQKNFHKIDFPQRGIGLSCGFEGTCYFGSQMYKDSDPSLEVTWEDENHLTIHTPLFSKQSIDVLKNKISTRLGLSYGNINVDSHFSISEEPLIPDVVNSNISVTTALLDRCCDALLKARSQKKKFPIIVQRRITEKQKKQWNQKKFEGTPFLTESFGIAMVDLQIDMNTFKPHILEIFMLIDGGKIQNMDVARNRIKLAIQNILSGMLEDEIGSPEKINIEFVESSKDSAQIGELPYQILPSAITQAISQIVGQPINEIPIKRDRIYEILLDRTNALEIDGYTKTNETEEDLLETLLQYRR